MERADGDPLATPKAVDPVKLDDGAKALADATRAARRVATVFILFFPINLFYDLKIVYVVCSYVRMYSLNESFFL